MGGAGADVYRATELTHSAQGLFTACQACLRPELELNFRSENRNAPGGYIAVRAYTHSLLRHDTRAGRHGQQGAAVYGI